MALGSKYVEASSGATHKKADASFVDLINPMAELDSTGSMLRSVLHIGGTFLITTKVKTGSWY